METENLFSQILVAPIQEGADHLFVITGFATSAMAFHHFQEAKRLEAPLNIHLIVGMAGYLGIPKTHHVGFKSLMEKEAKGSFECSYYTESPPVHSKVYIWKRGEKLLNSYCGSANYTQTAFLGKQKEAMADCDPEIAFAYYQSLIGDTLYCTHSDSEELVVVGSREFLPLQKPLPPEAESKEAQDEVVALPSVELSFLDNNGRLPTRSGLNWGQRPEYRREPNQAYIKVPSPVSKSGFFPPRGQPFTVLTDDDKSLIMTPAQDNAKALETPQNNSLIGEYFRNRLGVANGAPVTLEHLERYGRTGVTFKKIDEETYYMDFSKNP